jgi:hypothetical protein
MAVQLEQSPFLNLISQGRIQHTLSLMDKPADTRLTPEIAREVCERTASSAELEGSIASLGSQYILGLRATPIRYLPLHRFNDRLWHIPRPGSKQGLLILAEPLSALWMTQ